MAASIPRHIRNARLSYLPRRAIVGSRLVCPPGGGSLLYDVIMLSEKEFLRARLYLSSEVSGTLELTMSKLTPAYIPLDTKEYMVPAEAADPFLAARNYFSGVFGLL